MQQLTSIVIALTLVACGGSGGGDAALPCGGRYVQGDGEGITASYTYEDGQLVLDEQVYDGGETSTGRWTWDGDHVLVDEYEGPDYDYRTQYTWQGDNITVVDLQDRRGDFSSRQTLEYTGNKLASWARDYVAATRGDVTATLTWSGDTMSSEQACRTTDCWVTERTYEVADGEPRWLSWEQDAQSDGTADTRGSRTFNALGKVEHRIEEERTGTEWAMTEELTLTFGVLGEPQVLTAVVPGDPVNTYTLTYSYDCP